MKKVSLFENLTEPSGLVVTLDELKEWLRISGTDEDTTLTFILTAAQQKISCYLNITLLRHNVRGNYSCLECSKFERFPFISFKKFPLDAVSKVAVWDGTAYVDLTVTTDYIVEQRSKAFPRVLFKNTADFPTVSIADEVAYPIRIEASVGYEDADAVPELIKLAIKQYAALLYDNRGDCSDCDCDSDGTISLPNDVMVAISCFKLREVFG